MSWDVLDFDTNTNSDHHSLISCDISDSEDHMNSSVAKTSWLCYYMSQRQHNLSSHKETMESCDPDYFDYRNGECMQGISDEEGSASSSLSSTIQDAAFKVVLGYSCSPASEAASEFIVPMLKSYDQVQMVAHNPSNRKVLHSRAETLAKVIPNLSIIEDTSNRRPSSIIMEYSNESQAELIVCGASQHNSMHRALFGDTVMELIKHAEQAVLIVSASTLCRRDRNKTHKWMLCVDGSAGSLRSASLLGRCLLPHDEVHIFTCVSAEPNGMSRSMIRAKEAEVNEWMPCIWHSLSHRLEPNIHVVYSCKPASQVALEWASKNEVGSIVCGRNFNEDEHISSFVNHIVQNAQAFNVLVA